MVSRFFKYPKNNSFFLLGPRGTGKSFFIRHQFPKATVINLLEDHVYRPLLANPSRLTEWIPKNPQDWIVIDEIQKIPALLDEVHRLIEEKKWHFILTGSSARKLKSSGANLLAGRAFSHHAYPFTALELKDHFNLKRALEVGLLPKAYLEETSKDYLNSYISTYLREEVLQEGLTRQLDTFSRFMETASFSQGHILNYSKIGAESSIERKTVTNFFQILEDLLLARTLDVFSLRAKRDLIKQRKFYYFDVGVFRTLRPRGPLDSDMELLGACVETLVFQELVARNEYQSWDYRIHFWHTSKHIEVDFILYGPRGIKAIEVKSSSRIRDEDLQGLLTFKEDYPKAELLLVYGGNEVRKKGDISFIPLEDFLKNTDQWV